MCGISGLVNKKQLLTAPECTKLINRANIHLEHRGPDGKGVWLSADAKVALGHTRLSILDLSNSADQPMQDVTQRYTLTYNGELYNYIELREFLKNNFKIKFNSTGDTEVFLQGLICLGVEKFLSLADGMFAASFYDKEKNELYLMRDRAGEKPLYYFNEEELFAFASELKPLIELKNNPAIDESSLYLYLLLRYVPAPHSIIKDIFKLEAGHFARYDLNTHTFSSYPYFSWEQDPDQFQPSIENFNKTIVTIEEQLIESLRHRLLSDVPVGFFLSGGIDSSLCAALAKQHFGTEINSYTVQFENDPDSEHEVSEKTSKLLGLNHHNRFITISELQDRSKSIIQAMDEPNGDRSCIPTFLLAEFARRDVKVAIGGDGGDELFGGYSRYANINNSLSPHTYTTPLNTLFAYYSYLLPVFGAQEAQRLLGHVPNPALQHLESLSLLLTPPLNIEQSIRFVDFREYLPGSVLSKVDRMSMLSSLEVRTPFFSRSLLNTSSRLPVEFLSQQGNSKIILRHIAKRNKLDHLSSLKKRGFGMPAAFLLGDNEKLNQRFINSVESIKRSPLIRNMQRPVIDYFKSIKATNINSVWATIVLGEWLEGLLN
jgi:asparagine synthase (glutamine-hydrolysing)